MLRKTRFSGSLILSILLLVMLNNTNITTGYTSEISSELQLDSENYARIADTLFEQEPTNPTQILRYRLLAENPEIAQRTTTVKKSMAQVEESVGNTRSFYIIESFLVAEYNYVTKSATMLAKGDNCYVYILDDVIASYGVPGATTKAESWRDEFESKIYPNEVLYFGSPDGTLGDIDGDSHVTILMALFDGGVAGYFDMRNELVLEFSNEREMVHVDYETTYGVLAHELEHLIHYNYDINERWWVDEGCAEFAKYLGGYDMSNNLTLFARDFFAHYPDNSLLYWNYYEEGGRNVRIDYGSAYMFIFYIAEKYGYDAIKEIVSQELVGARGVEEALRASGISIAFNDLFLNWATALYVDDASFAGGIYGFDNLDISMDYDLMSSFPVTRVDRENRYYGIYAAKLNSPADLMILNTESTADNPLGISIAVHDLDGWSVEKSVQAGTITDMINGTSIDEAYLITSIMNSTTPYVGSDEQFTVGLIYDIDFTLSLGTGLFIDSHIYSYEQSTWNFSLTNVVVFDENATEIVNGSSINIIAQFRYEGSCVVYKSLEMNYSISLDWHLEQSLQSFDENSFDLYIVASGLLQYGRKSVSSLTVPHTLTVEQPEVTLNSRSIGLYVSVNASYTQLYGWEAFTKNVRTRIVLYDSEGKYIDTFSISYNENTNRWGVAFVDLSRIWGEHYVEVTFGYARRTVWSPESDIFMAKGNPDGTNVEFSPWFIVLLAISSISIPIIGKRTRK